VIACDDGIDNDGDGRIDFPADPGCEAAADPSEEAAAAAPECNDGIDNDADGATDLRDRGCDGPDDPSERTAPNVIACDDGIDNDGDGTIDYQGDPGCGSRTQKTESPMCNDGLDNNRNGLIDFDGGDSLDLDRDGFIDPQFNPAGPAVTAPDPYCTTAYADQEKSRRSRRGWGRWRPPHWRHKCRWCPPERKVTLCHKLKKTLSVGESAVPAHLAHGDWLGSCSPKALKTPKYRRPWKGDRRHRWSFSRSDDDSDDDSDD
jgi:hypothetical protein